MNDVRVYLGIDPGGKGGIAAIGYDEEANTFVPYWTMPLEKLTERDIWEGLRFRHASWAVLEKVGASPQMGRTSAFSFGKSYGFLRGVLTASKIPFDEVSPQKWQKALGCLSGGDKRVTRAKAQQLFPNIKVTHAIADCLLIAEYARRTYVTSKEPPR